MFSVLVVCLVVSSSAMSSLTVPKSFVVVIGERVEMKCNVNGSQSTKWTFTAWNASTETYIYLSIDILPSKRSRYKIDKRISGQHNLIIDSVDLAHAGRYRCTTAIPEMLWNDIQLTVLVSSPKCSSSAYHADESIIEHGYLWMWCRIIYMPIGNIIPTFTWTKDNTKNVIVANTTTASDSGTTTSSVLTQVHSDDNGTTFKCKIRPTFQLQNNTGVYAPDYEYTWDHTVYGPRNLIIVVYEDRLECSADGNPTPIYRWTDVETNTSTEGHGLKLDASYDKNHTFQCIAYNILGAKNKNVTIAGHPKDPGLTQDLSYFPITAFAIGGSLLFLLTTTIIVSCVVHRKRLKDAIQPCNPDEDTEVQRAAESDNYCALMKQPTAAQEQQVYCELRSFDEQSIKQSKEKVENKDCVYVNVHATLL